MSSGASNTGKIWVEWDKTPVKIPYNVDEVTHVDDFISACKQHLTPGLDKVDVTKINLIDQNYQELSRILPLAEVCSTRPSDPQTGLWTVVVAKKGPAASAQKDQLHAQYLEVMSVDGDDSEEEEEKSAKGGSAAGKKIQPHRPHAKSHEVVHVDYESPEDKAQGATGGSSAAKKVSVPVKAPGIASKARREGKQAAQLQTVSFADDVTLKHLAKSDTPTGRTGAQQAATAKSYIKCSYCPKEHPKKALQMLCCKCGLLTVCGEVKGRTFVCCKHAVQAAAMETSETSTTTTAGTSATRNAAPTRVAATAAAAAAAAAAATAEPPQAATTQEQAELGCREVGRATELPGAQQHQQQEQRRTPPPPSPAMKRVYRADGTSQLLPLTWREACFLTRRLPSCDRAGRAVFCRKCGLTIDEHSMHLYLQYKTAPSPPAEPEDVVVGDQQLLCDWCHKQCYTACSFRTVENLHLCCSCQTVEEFSCGSDVQNGEHGVCPVEDIIDESELYPDYWPVIVWQPEAAHAGPSNATTTADAPEPSLLAVTRTIQAIVAGQMECPRSGLPHEHRDRPHMLLPRGLAAPSASAAAPATAQSGSSSSTTTSVSLATRTTAAAAVITTDVHVGATTVTSSAAVPVVSVESVQSASHAVEPPLSPGAVTRKRKQAALAAAAAATSGGGAAARSSVPQQEEEEEEPEPEQPEQEKKKGRKKK